MNVFFLEVDRHPGGFQTAAACKGIHGVPGEPGQRFCNDHVNFSAQGIGHHAVKTVPIANGQAGNAVIGIHSGKKPVRVALDVVCEILPLGLQTVLLGFFHGALYQIAVSLPS